MSERRAVIVATGGANTASLQFALDRLGVTSMISADAAHIRTATHVILPGVGAASGAMQKLRAAGLDALIPTLPQPVLGICLGMQLLYQISEEGHTPCLGILSGTARKLTAAPGRPVPHMGWNTLSIDRRCALLEGISAGTHVYFVHSYAVPPGEETLAQAHYGEAFSACVQRRNFFGMQFHPERSAEAGSRLLANFLALN